MKLVVFWLHAIVILIATLTSCAFARQLTSDCQDPKYYDCNNTDNNGGYVGNSSHRSIGYG